MSYILISSVHLYDPKVSMLDVMTAMNGYMHAGRRCLESSLCVLSVILDAITTDIPAYWNTQQMNYYTMLSLLPSSVTRERNRTRSVT